MTGVPKNSNKDNTSSIAEFKKGKIVFKQKPLSFESFSETMQEIVEFRAYAQSLDSPLSVVPQDYLPLIAKLVQESDKPLSTLTKSLLSLLFPPNSASRALSDIAVLTQAVEDAIKNVAERVNYGISSELQKPPPSCTVWRWEVKDFGWLPESIRETALTRLTERKQAKKFLQLCFDNSSEEEKSTILGKKPVQEASITMKEKPDKKSFKVIKEKRETESTKRSAAAFANYFLKTKATPQIDSSEATSPKIPNDFENTFKPFLVKKSVHVSPTNWFTISRRNGNCDIVEEDGNLVEVYRNSDKNVSKHWLSGPLSSYFPPDTPSLHLVRKTLSARRQFRKENQYSVRCLVNQSNEAELQGDQNDVRKYLSILKNRKLIPVKILFFSENNRPGYLGTWTKTSVKIGPRTPFALDPKALDYDYDSDAEWEVDESGEDVDSEGDSIEEDSSSTASDLDHWLVDCDEVIEDPARSFNVDDKKRKAVGTIDEGKSHNKRRRVVPLVPFTKGPIYETFLGVCEYDLFKQMRIQMFNDSPVPSNPFDVVPSTTVERTEALSHNITKQQSTNISQLANNKQNMVNIPKTSFPDAHIEALLRKAVTINTSSLAVLVDVVYQDLRSLGIKKNALELKIREVLEKHKETKLWKVKESAWIRYGLTKPQASMT